jgi:uncharacterized membrane-anchored protein YhcB (DUF1043 family)
MFWSSFDWASLGVGLLIGGAIGAVVMGVVASGSAEKVVTEDRFQLGVDWANAQHREARRQAGLKAGQTRKARVSA